jgi:RIO kinase 1
MSKRSRRRRFDDDEPDFSSRRGTVAITSSFEPSPSGPLRGEADDEPPDPTWSTYNHPDAVRGPGPRPSWVITSATALDEDLGVLKSGKEADVSLVRRRDGERVSLMAVKRYRDAQHRMFHRDVGYLEGRKERKSRQARAIATRTAFGRALIAGRWAGAEFAVLSRLWTAGAPVPYPVQVLDTELMMEFIGSPAGVAAPRLAQLRPAPDELADLWHQMRDALAVLAAAGYAHGDLSVYNALVHEGRLVLIDLPQAVDLVGNPQGFAYLRRDCGNICAWFVARGIDADPVELELELKRAL